MKIAYTIRYKGFKTLSYFIVNKLKLLVFMVAFLVSLILVGSAVYAQSGFADSPCDPNYYKSLEARAWMEAQREITQNQNLIFKPDSVLEYTCFDGHLSELAEHAKDMFSESTRWGTAYGNMEGSLNTLVSGSLGEYESNFQGTFLNGRSNVTRRLPSSISKGAYACQLMQNVWQAAKCMNFVDASSDGFYTLADYASGGERRSGCAKDPRWTSEPDVAIPPLGATTPWEADNVVSHLERFSDDACSKSDKIKTGLIVGPIDTNPNYYEEHVCLIDKCVWQASGSGTVAYPSSSGQCVEEIK